MCPVCVIRSSVDGDVGSFCLVAIVNHAVVNLDVQLSLGDPAVSPLDVCPKMGWVGCSNTFFLQRVRSRVLPCWAEGNGPVIKSARF